MKSRGTGSNSISQKLSLLRFYSILLHKYFSSKWCLVTTKFQFQNASSHANCPLYQPFTRPPEKSQFLTLIFSTLEILGFKKFKFLKGTSCVLKLFSPFLLLLMEDNFSFTLDKFFSLHREYKVCISTW